MTQEMYIQNLKPFLKNRSRLEKNLGIQIEIKGKIIFAKGKVENEYIAMQVFEAINSGFPIEKALLLKDENFVFQKLNIKDITPRKDLKTIRGRIIGTKGKTLSTLMNLSNCYIILKDNEIGIIGDSEFIEEAIIAVKSLIQGSKHGNVYSRLERENKKKRLEFKRNFYIKKVPRKKF